MTIWQAKKAAEHDGESEEETGSPFVGIWHIVSMETWDEDYFNEEVQAFIEFEDNGTGHFQFGYVSGLHGLATWHTGRATRRGVVLGRRRRRLTGTPMTGRGWAKLEGDELHGMIVIHLGDDVPFVAKRARLQKRHKKK